MCTSCALCRCKNMCKLQLVCSHVGAKTCANCTSFAPPFAPCKVQFAPFFSPLQVQFAPFFAPLQVQLHLEWWKKRCKLHLGWCKKWCKLHLGWCKKWCKRGAICTCFCTYMVQKMVQTRCNLHMFLHLDGAKNGAHEFQILVLCTNDVNTYACIFVM